MITDEQIEACKIAANESYKRFKNSVRGQIVMPQDDWEWHFAQAVFKMAQEVRPLVFGRDEDGDLVCITGCKIYVILNLSEGFGYAGRLYEIEEKAIAAAQADFNRRVLENLTHGGRNET